MGVADWETRLVEILPDGLKGSLPTIEEIEAELHEHGLNEDHRRDNASGQRDAAGCGRIAVLARQ